MDEPTLSFCVLSSSSSGNCSALVVTRGSERSLFLIDLGLSPRRTRTLLEEVGLRDVPLAGVLLTHMDADHCQLAWAGELPERTRLYVHKRHRGRAERAGFLYGPTEILSCGGDAWSAESSENSRGGEAIELAPGLTCKPIVQSHDDAGVVAFRFELESGGETHSLGFATDLGCATEELIRHLSGVDTLAIESNYCPRMQALSPRPDFLKRRITGGSGHLSNPQCAKATAQIGPTGEVVLLHLSRQCNSPILAGLGHRGRGYRTTISKPDGPTGWIGVRKGLARGLGAVQMSLF